MTGDAALIAGIGESGLRSGGTVSFHHHLRNGDTVMEAALAACRTLGLSDLHLAASSLFPRHASLVPFLQDGTVTRITTAYMNGPLAEFVSRGGLADPVRLTTHGGRARKIARGAAPDLAVIAAPAVDGAGNLGRADGPWACGPLGYPMVDATHAAHVLAVTAHETDRLPRICIPGERVDRVARVHSIGDASQIESGTTARRISPAALAMAEQAAALIVAAGCLRDGLRFQTGAGGASLQVARALAPEMARAGITGDFTAGGITAAHLEMVRSGLFRRIMDVQAFDLAAVRSYAVDPWHHAMSAAEYADPDRPDRIARQLDVMILGAAEVDVAFNVNVTTTGGGRIIGGSGGHADTAEGAGRAIVVVPVESKGVARIVDRVRCITTPGAHVDAVVTDRGICVNPARPDLAADLRKAGLALADIRDLARSAPPRPDGTRIVAISEDPRGAVLDEIARISA